MKFGISLFGHHPLDRSPIENFKSVLVLARSAAENGFDLVSAGQHYMVRSFQKFQTLPAMARVAAEVEGLYVNLLDILPLNHPIRVAEQMATMDALTGGRAILTAVLGYGDHEFRNFGIPKNERVGRYRESIEIIKRLWTEDNVTYEGRYFQLENVTINPKPVQKPRPPIWVTADATKGVIRAAEIGDAWLMSNHTRVVDLKKQLEVYQANRRNNDDATQGIGIRRPLMRLLSIAPTRAEALDAARPDIEDTWKKYYGELGQAAEMDDPDDFTQEFDALWKGRFLIGTPEDCIREIEVYQKELDADLLMVSIGGSLDSKLRVLDLFGREVIPHFKSQ